MVSSSSGATERGQISKEYSKKLAEINALEPVLSALSDEELKQTTDKLRKELAQHSKLEKIVPYAFAAVREASKRVLGQRHYDVQMIGGLALHQGYVAEMRTGEGKTLVASLAAYLNALPGLGVHVITVNDYLASRDKSITGPVLEALGMTVGLIVPNLSDEDRRSAYAADVTYATNNELGFDYLKDNLKTELGEMVQRSLNYAIIDEVDSILIDEARTPLIITGPAEDRSAFYTAIDRVILRIPKAEVEYDEKEKTVVLTDNGLQMAENMLVQMNAMKDGTHLYDEENGQVLHHVNAALRAHHMFFRDKQYLVKGSEILIVDEFTGRTMPGRRFSEGIHQAIEAKERVMIMPESDTLASITFQNFFREYNKISGMTGTGATEEDEFAQIYGLGIKVIPTNKPIARVDVADEIYRTQEEKLQAILVEINLAHARMQPVLVGTASIEKSEEMAAFLVENGFTQVDPADPNAIKMLYEGAESGVPTKRFTVLNARNHGQEANIVAEAGVPGAITIATNMAGRGTDIKLGGNPDLKAGTDEYEEALAKAERFGNQAREAGGLYVIGTERNESRRIDNQLRGRAGRQGDPGRSKFFLAFTDDVLRIFGKMEKIADQIDLKPGEAISSGLVTSAISKAQKGMEAHNFNIRRQVVQFDDVVNEQRKAILSQRMELLAGNADYYEETIAMAEDVVEGLYQKQAAKGDYVEVWDLNELISDVNEVLRFDLPIKLEGENLSTPELDDINVMIKDRLVVIKDSYEGDFNREVLRQYMLMTLDYAWREHMAYLDHLKTAVSMRSVGQRDPLAEFRVEATEAFHRMINHWHETYLKEAFKDRSQSHDVEKIVEVA